MGDIMLRTLQACASERDGRVGARNSRPIATSNSLLIKDLRAPRCHRSQTSVIFHGTGLLVSLMENATRFFKNALCLGLDFAGVFSFERRPEPVFTRADQSEPVFSKPNQPESVRPKSTGIEFCGRARFRDCGFRQFARRSRTQRESAESFAREESFYGRGYGGHGWSAAAAQDGWP